MEGDWIAVVEWRAGGCGSRLDVRLVEPEVGASDASRVFSGERGAILAGALELPGGRAGQAEDLLAGRRSPSERFLRQLRGRFAGVIWDGARREVLALRDPMGVYPLFVSSWRGGLLLSPSIERLREREGGAGSVNRLALAEHLFHRWPDKQHTYFENVRRIPAGHVLEAREAGEVLQRYWDPGATATRDPEAPDADGDFERFEALFERAIRRCSAGRPTGVFLSGGLDSVSIASRLVRQDPAGRRPLALSLAFGHPDCDETEIQTAVAQRLGMQQELRRVSVPRRAAGPLERARRLSASWPVPLMNVWNGEFHRLAEAGRDLGCEVILTGSGGDDWLGVSPYLAADLLRSARLPTLVRLVRSMRASYGMQAHFAARRVLWEFGVRAIAREALGGFLHARARRLDRGLRARRARRACPRWLAPEPELRQALLAPARMRRAGKPGESFYVREMRRGLDHPLLALELEESFEIGRRLGVRFAHPFLDPDLVEYLYRFRPEVLIGMGGPDRALVRDGLAERFPDLGFDRLRKSDARSFFAELARTEGARVWRRLGGPSALERLGIVDGRRLESELGPMLSSTKTTSGWYRLWDLINLEQWLRARYP